MFASPAQLAIESERYFMETVLYYLLLNIEVGRVKIHLKAGFESNSTSGLAT